MLSVNNNEFMWENKYRPQTIEECILPEKDKQRFLDIVESGKIRNMLLVSNSPGTGKTTVAKALINDTNSDMLFYNTSDVGVSTIREEIRRYATSMSLTGKRRVVVLDEFDRASADLQKTLLSFVEEYSNNCSFILTGNNIHAFIPPIRSRFPAVEFGAAHDERVQLMKQMIKRCGLILKNENVEFDNKVIASLVKKNFPDFRSTVIAMEDNVIKGVLDEGVLDVKTPDQEMEELFEHLKNKKFAFIRENAIKWANDYPSFIKRFYDGCYKRLDPATLPMVIEVISENNADANKAVNMEIHISGLMVKVMMSVRWKDGS